MTIKSGLSIQLWSDGKLYLQNSIYKLEISKDCKVRLTYKGSGNWKAIFDITGNTGLKLFSLRAPIT